jgi:hypothetical protein
MTVESNPCHLCQPQLIRYNSQLVMGLSFRIKIFKYTQEHPIAQTNIVSCSHMFSLWQKWGARKWIQFETKV